ncbi:MAG: hypothetical protein IPJ07_26985 [Acidobacteria bacterium]|nr:hypothetical protein [Acidobacteriota bacterium]
MTDLFITGTFTLCSATEIEACVPGRTSASIIFAERGIPGNPPPAENVRGFNRLSTRHADALSIPPNISTGSWHLTHPAQTWTDWRDNDPLVEPIVEIYQGDRQNYEMPDAPRSNSAQDSIGGWRPKGFVSLALEKGYKLGFEAKSSITFPLI